jgi:HD superfamily phosphohydrolase YqeK
VALLLLDIHLAAKYVSVYGEDAEYPRYLREALEIADRIERDRREEERRRVNIDNLAAAMVEEEDEFWTVIKSGKYQPPEPGSRCREYDDLLGFAEA